MVRGQNWKLFLVSCALAPGFDQRDFTARRLGELLSGNREWALETCLSWVGEYFRLTSLRACLLSCEEDPKEKLPCYDFIVYTRYTTKGLCKKKSSPAFDIWPHPRPAFRDYAISLHLLFSSAFDRSIF